jgi:hypothetical protein
MFCCVSSSYTVDRWPSFIGRLNIWYILIFFFPFFLVFSCWLLNTIQVEPRVGLTHWNEDNTHTKRIRIKKKINRERKEYKKQTYREDIVTSTAEGVKYKRKKKKKKERYEKGISIIVSISLYTHTQENNTRQET